MSKHYARKMPISHKVSGNLPNTSFAVFYMFYSRFALAPDPLEESCIKSKFSQVFFAEFVKYVIEAFGLSPKTMGELIKGMSLTVFRKPYKVLLTG